MTFLFGIGGFGFGLFSALDQFDFDDLTLYYIALLIVQYVTKPNARKTVGICVREAVAGSLDEAVRDAFNVETAVGAQLDAIATYRGAQRNVFGITLVNQYFSYALYSDVDPTIFKGYALYTDVLVDWFFQNYFGAGQPTYSMNDDQLRRLVKFLALSQSNFLSLQELDAILFEFFGAFVTLTDNGDMTITYTHNLTDPDVLFGIVRDTGNLPAPAGVQVILA